MQTCIRNSFLSVQAKIGMAGRAPDSSAVGTAVISPFFPQTHLHVTRMNFNFWKAALAKDRPP